MFTVREEKSAFEANLTIPYFIGYILNRFEWNLMKREFIETPSFTKKWFSLGFTEDDLAELQEFLLKNPDAGNIIVGTGGLRKIRYAFDGKGKSGSARVCYVDFAAFEKNYLIQVFSKNEKQNLSDSEKNSVKKAIEILKAEATKKQEEIK